MAYTKWGVFIAEYNQYLLRSGTSWRPPSNWSMAFRTYGISVIPTGSTYHRIFRKGGSSGIYLIDIQWRDSDSLRCTIRSASGSTVVISWSSVTEVWEEQRWFIRCTMANPNTTKMELFLNGVSQGNGSVITGGTVTSLQSGAGNLFIGENWCGGLSEVAAFDGLVSDERILAYATADIGASDADLYSFWTLDGDGNDSFSGYHTTPGVGAAAPNFLDIPSFGADTNPPVISNITPTAGGNLAANYNLARLTPIEFDVIDLDPGVSLVVITVKYLGASDTIVAYDGTNWLYPFYGSVSEKTSISNGYHFKILPLDGWANEVEDLFVYATDGNVEAVPL